MKKSVLTGRAVTDARILQFPSAKFPETDSEDAGVDPAVLWV